jgi:hypothetical protein
VNNENFSKEIEIIEEEIYDEIPISLTIMPGGVGNNNNCFVELNQSYTLY